MRAWAAPRAPQAQPGHLLPPLQAGLSPAPCGSQGAVGILYNNPQEPEWGREGQSWHRAGPREEPSWMPAGPSPAGSPWGTPCLHAVRARGLLEKSLPGLPSWRGWPPGWACVPCHPPIQPDDSSACGPGPQQEPVLCPGAAFSSWLLPRVTCPATHMGAPTMGTHGPAAAPADHSVSLRGRESRRLARCPDHGTQGHEHLSARARLSPTHPGSWCSRDGWRRRNLLGLGHRPPHACWPPCAGLQSLQGQRPTRLHTAPGTDCSEARPGFPR